MVVIVSEIVFVFVVVVVCRSNAKAAPFFIVAAIAVVVVVVAGRAHAHHFEVVVFLLVVVVVVVVKGRYHVEADAYVHLLTLTLKLDTCGAHANILANANRNLKRYAEYKRCRLHGSVRATAHVNFKHRNAGCTSFSQRHAWDWRYVYVGSTREVHPAERPRDEPTTLAVDAYELPVRSTSSQCPPTTHPERRRVVQLRGGRVLLVADGVVELARQFAEWRGQRDSFFPSFQHGGCVKVLPSHALGDSLVEVVDDALPSVFVVECGRPRRGWRRCVVGV
mmetsp:Transcript_12097/g.27439  ORF Transcript_12097/g.27439 Transcript_12097/m.27439 type:complete len:279 (+) Transcript_12097:884-1720(+)